MSELGRLLTEARAAKDLSLADVEAAIRVRQKYLEALEQGNYAVLPPGAIARGFLRNYANFLGVDYPAVLRLYQQESGDRGPASPQASLEGLRATDYRPLEVSLINESEPSHWGAWVIAFLVIAALVAGGWWLFNNSSTLGGTFSFDRIPNLLAALGPQRPTSTVTATATRPAATITPPAAPPAVATVELASNTIEPAGPTMTPTSDLLTLPIPTAQPTATNTPTPEPTATPEVAQGISLTLHTTQRAWMKVTVDGKVVLQDLLEAGQTRGYDAAQQMIVLTGNAGGVTITVNGENFGTMGNIGQVVERTWAVDADGQVSEVATDKRTVVPAPQETATPTP